ncbi:MAG: phage P22, antirepressor protein [Rhodobacteraceae bacterium]|nr:phage P22, antirepressor protein [Paracoccaceae bacterium]MBR9823031.1 phage P22, antirepressor protein [Paracoccaceae bacterium]
MTNIVTVDFRGDTLFGFQEGENTFVALRPIVEAMGMDWSGQLQRVKRDPILSEGVGIMPTPFGRGGDQEAVCIKLDLLNGWLFTIDTNRIKDDSVRQKVLTYQRECYRVLHDHFAGKHRARVEAEVPEEIDASEGVKLRHVTEARQTFGTQAAAQMWFRLGLPVVPAMLQDPRQLNLLDYQAIDTKGGEA